MRSCEINFTPCTLATGLGIMRVVAVNVARGE